MYLCAALNGFIPACNATFRGTFLDSSQDARRVILEGDGTTDMAGGSINGGTGFIHGNPFKYTGAAATSTLANYIIASVNNGNVKMVLLQVCDWETQVAGSSTFDAIF